MKPPFEELDPLKIVLPAKLESERLLLRCYELSDAAMYAGMVDQNRERLQDDFPNRRDVIRNEQDAESFIWQMIQMWEMRRAFHFCVLEKQSHSYVGEVFFTDIVWRVPKADIGYYVVREWEGKGMATEALKTLLPFAFETLEMRKLQVRCVVDNLRSQQVAERCGFKIEGVLRNDFVKADGQTLVNLVYYGMTPTDYRAISMKPPIAGDFN